MKTLLTILLSFIGTCLSCTVHAQNQEEERDTSTTLTLDKLEHNFGAIMEGDTVKAVFKVKNIGAYDLYIRQIFPSCGCSVVDFKMTAIKQGEEIDVTVVFDSYHKDGEVENTFQMFSNAGFQTFYLRGFVVKK